MNRRNFLKSIIGGIAVTAVPSIAETKPNFIFTTDNSEPFKDMGKDRRYYNADDLIVEGRGDSGISILTPDSKDGRIYFGESNDVVGYVENNKMVFTVPGKEVLRIDSSQNVGLGIVTPDKQFHVVGK